MALDSYELYLAKKIHTNVRNYFDQGKITLQEARELALEHVREHAGTAQLFLRAGILTNQDLTDIVPAPPAPSPGTPA